MTVGQVVTFLSHVFNEMHDQSIVMELNEKFDDHAYVREYLLMIISNFSLMNLNDLKFRSSILAKLTETPNQLSRKSSVRIFSRLLSASFLPFFSISDRKSVNIHPMFSNSCPEKSHSNISI